MKNIYLIDLYRRLRLGRRWVAAQFLLTAPLILLGVAWLLIPEKHAWQVALTFLLALLLAVSALELQAGTMRSLADDDGKRVKLPWGALSLLVWIAVGWVAWALLDWCDAQIPQWALLLNSESSSGWRAKLLTYEHIYLWMTYIEWALRWIIVPASVIPYAIASAQSGWRLPVRRVLQLLGNWRWWAGVTIVALGCVCLPNHFYSADPHGSVHAQELRVALKLAASYLLGVGGWLLLLAWAGVLFARQKPLPENDALTELFDRLRVYRRWVWGAFGWAALSVLDDLTLERLSDNQSWIKMIAAFTLILLALILVAGMLRSLLSDEVKRVRMVWGTLSMLIWVVLALIIAFSLSLWYVPIAPWVLSWVVAPAILFPFAASSAVWGLRLPWRRILRLLLNWRWWLGLTAEAVVGVALPDLINFATRSASAPESLWRAGVKEGINGVLATGSWILLLGWFAVLFNRTLPTASDVSVEVATPVTAE